MNCLHCRKPISEDRLKHRAKYCSDQCRRDSWEYRHFPGQCVGVRQLKTGQWSVTMHFTDFPSIAVGERVKVETVGD